MTRSETLIEPKNKFHRRIDQFFACAVAEACRQHPWKILSTIDPDKSRDIICSCIEKYQPLHFYLELLKPHRNKDYYADAIILNQAT